MLLTGVKDLNFRILNELDDIDLVNICQTNKAADKICTDQKFWLNRIMIKFPYLSNIINKYKGDRTWSEYYIDDLIKVNPYDPYALNVAKTTNRDDHVMIIYTTKGKGLPTRYKRGYNYNILDLYSNVENGYNTRKEFEEFYHKITDVGGVIVDNNGTDLISYIFEVEDILGSYEPLNSGQVVIVFSYTEKRVKYVPSYQMRLPDNFVIWSK